MSVKVIERLDQKCCGKVNCPAILKTENGDILVIGKNVTNDVDGLKNFNSGIGSDEAAVIIPKDVFESVK